MSETSNDPQQSRTDSGELTEHTTTWSICVTDMHQPTLHKVQIVAIRASERLVGSVACSLFPAVVPGFGKYRFNRLSRR